ncbi:DUF4294 domain-containing protein [Olivibacter sitiensis]|uniref:DUF4294 domain-containing protein n=1 Tax=Olivibacter sitiensis TaxID=376470 RepID=UPI0004079070|nr:DUF4294 domain-containing protein [Olivibacter sitiensis]
MKNRLLFVVPVFLFFSGKTMAQDMAIVDTASAPKRQIKLPVTVINGERLPWIPLPEVQVYAVRVFKTPEEKAKYNRLKYNVMKVLPYARFAEQRYDKLQRDLAMTGDRKEQKRLVKACEAEIKGMFNREIKKMSVNQGKILIMLIDRQTGSSSYELVRELRGGVSAFFYQSVARVFGHNLKATYDPEEQRDIENILRNVDRTYHYF